VSQGIESLLGVVAPEVLVDAVETSRHLTELGVPHALIGGLAVGLHGHPRATRDVDYLVGHEAFERTEPLLGYREELKELVRVGRVDLVGIPPDHPELVEHLALPEEGEIPVLPVTALVLMKLSAGRPQDLADVSALIEAGVNPDEVALYLREKAPELVARFAEIIG
jgi:hypothetical protein